MGLSYLVHLFLHCNLITSHLSQIDMVCFASLLLPVIHAATACRLSGCPAAVCRCGQVRERRLRKRAREGKDDLTKGFVSPIMAYLPLFSNENTTLPRLKDNVVCLVDSSLLRVTSLRLFPNGKNDLAIKIASEISTICQRSAGKPTWFEAQYYLVVRITS